MVITPVRITRSNTSSNSTSRNRQRKAHPNESRYSNRSYIEKSTRQHEVEDLTPVQPAATEVTPYAMIRRQISSRSERDRGVSGRLPQVESRLSALRYRFGLALVLSLHGIAVTTYLFVLVMHWRMSETTRRLLMPSYLVRGGFPALAACNITLVCLHTLFMARMVGLMLFPRRKRAIASLRILPQKHVHAAKSVQGARPSLIHALWLQINLHSHCKTIFLLQLVIQTQQAYAMSCRVPSGYWNRLHTTMIVAASWLTLVLRIRRQFASCRLHWFIGSLLLDVTAVCVLPLGLLIANRQELVRQDSDDHHTLFTSWGLRDGDDAALLNHLSELHFGAIASPWMLVQYLFFSGHLLVCLFVLLSMLQSARQPTTIQFRPRDHNNKGSATRCSGTKKPAKITKWDIAMIMLLAGWGLVVLIAHLHATHLDGTKSTQSSCVVRMRPWFTNASSCALVDLSCAKLGIDSSQQDLDFLLQRAAPDLHHGLAASLLYLVIRDCPQLVLTPRLREFSALLRFKVVNSSLEQWDFDGSLTNSAHPELRSLAFVRVATPQLPPGLLSDDFPHLLTLVQVNTSSLNALPDVLASKWKSVQQLSIEGSQLSALAASGWLSMPLAKLSLRGNALHSVPSALFQIATLTSLLLSENPLDSLPSDVRQLSPALRWIALDSTDLSGSALPAWMVMAHGRSLRISLSRTPFCLVNGPASGSINSSVLSCQDADS